VFSSPTNLLEEAMKGPYSQKTVLCDFERSFAFL
jgi:hypothetical protein